MGISGFNAEGMADGDHLAVAGLPAGMGDDAVGGGKDIGAGAAGEISPLCRRRPPVLGSRR